VEKSAARDSIPKTSGSESECGVPTASLRPHARQGEFIDA